MSHPNNPTALFTQHITIEARLEQLEQNDATILTQLEALTDNIEKIRRQMQYVQAKLNEVRLDVADVYEKVRYAKETPTVQNTYHFNGVARINNTTNDIRGHAILE